MQRNQGKIVQFGGYRIPLGFSPFLVFQRFAGQSW